MIRVYIEGVGLRGPGLDGWAASLPVLSGAVAHVPAPVSVPPSALLPPNERRRAVQTVRLTLAVGAEAFAAAGRDAGETATIFTSSGGDGDTIHEILNVLASSNRELSPTRFHNSVHNTPAGYWGIATESRAPSSTLCCHDDSFAAGLLEAAAQATAERRAVTLIAYDVQYPEPLSLVRPIGAPFGVALVLTPVPTAAARAAVTLTLRPKCGVASAVASPTLEALRRTTPAARSLPLLAALARGVAAAVTLDYLGNLELALDVTPQLDVGAGVGHSEPVAG
ncbi:MAG: beta-ketoacyl synthase chain length factor [Alphaproteobacteria bacterium]|nr:beta-ketoacyl synthase chain length factor [Alphaproteobacteria bacterium]